VDVAAGVARRWRRHGQADRRRVSAPSIRLPVRDSRELSRLSAARFTLARKKVTRTVFHFFDAPPIGGKRADALLTLGHFVPKYHANLVRKRCRNEVLLMAEIVLNTSTLPEPLFSFNTCGKSARERS